MPVFRNTKSREIYNVPEEEMDSFAASVMDDGIAVERADVFQTRSGRRFLVGEGSRKTFVKQMSDLGMREAAFDTEKNEWYDAVDKANPSIAEADVGLARLTDLNAWKGFKDAQAAEKAEKDARKAKRLSTIVVQDTPSLFFGQNQGATPAGIPSGGRTEPLDQTTPTRDSLGVKPERETIMEVLGEHTRASARGFQGIGATVGRVGQMLFEADDTTALNRWSNKVANYSKFVEDFWVDQAENGWEAPRDEIEAAAWSEKPFTKAASVVGEAGPMMFAAIGAAVATRSAVVPAVMFGLDGGASTYVNAREAGKPIEKSQVLGLLNGAWTAATEKIPFDKALGDVGKGLIKRIASGSFIEPIQELVQTVGSNVVEKFGFDEGRNIMDGWIEALVGGFFLGGAMSGVVGGGGKSGLQENVEQEVKMNSARDAQLADELRSDAEAAQTIVSDPVAAKAARDAAEASRVPDSELAPLEPAVDTPEASDAAQGRTDALTATDDAAGQPAPSKAEVKAESDLRNLKARRKAYENSLANEENPPNSEEVAYLNDEIAKIDKQLGVEPEPAAQPKQEAAPVTPKVTEEKPLTPEEAVGKKLGGKVREGKELSLHTDKNGKIYSRPRKAVVVQVIDENTVRVSVKVSGQSSRTQEVKVTALSLRASELGSKRRAAKLAGLSKEERKEVSAKDKELKEALSFSPAFLSSGESAAIEALPEGRQRSTAKSQWYKRVLQDVKSELGLSDDTDMDDPTVRAKILPKVKELIAKVEADEGFDGNSPESRIREIKESNTAPVNEIDIDDGDLFYKDGEWFLASRVDGKEGVEVELKDGVTIPLGQVESIGVQGKLAIGDQGYDTALEEHLEQLKEEGKAGAEETIEEFRARNGLPSGEPAQGEMFGQGSVGDAFNLTQEEGTDGDRVQAEKTAQEESKAKSERDQQELPKEDKPKAQKAAEPPKATPDDNTIKLTHAETASALEAQGKSPDGKLSKENAEVLQQAKNEGADLKAESLAKTVLNKKTRRAISPVEHAGMVLRAGQVKVEIKRLMKKLDSDIDAGKDTSEDQGALSTQQDILTDLMLASDRAGSEAGRALQIRKIRIELETFTLENMAQRLKTAKQEALSPKEIKEVARLGKIIEAQEAEIKRLQDEIKDIGAKGEADAIVEHARKTRVKRKQDDIAKERKSLKEQLQSLGYRVNDITGTPALTLEAAKIIRKLALNYVDGGVNSLAEVRRLVQQDIPDLSDKGVYDSIGGRIQRIESMVVAEAKTESKEITRQAKLKGQIMDAYNKVFDPKRKTEPTSEEVTALKKQLAILEAAYRKTEFDQDTYDRKVNAIRDMRAQLDGLYRDIKPQKRKKDKLIRKAEAELARLTKKMAKTDELADLSEQIRTGKFKKPAISEDSKSPELDALRQSILHAREQIARITKGEAMKGKSDASTIESIQKSLAEVQKQIDDGYRKLPLPEKARSARVAEVKQDLKEALALRETLDRQEELKRRIRERDFAVTAKESVAIKSKQLAEARIKMAQLQREARALEFRVRKKTFGEKFANVASFPRSMLATLDMSYALRQAILPSVAHPRIAANAFGKAFKAFLSQNSYDAIDLDLKNHRDRPDFDKYGIYFSSIDAELGQREEFFMSTLAEKLPGVLRSERNMVTGLNLLRAGLMSDFLGKHPNASEEAKHAYARYVNIATGRGDLGKLSGAGEALASAFFAPRFAVSRIQVPYEAIITMAKHKELRGEIAKQWGAFLTTGLGILWLGSMAGASVGLDPDDSDWGKMVMGGNKHIDLWGGTQQPMRLLIKALKGMATGDGDSLKDIGRFLRYKLAPSVSLVSEQQTGKNAIGRKVEPHALGIDMPWRAASLLNSVTPLIIQSAVEAVRAGEDPAVVAGLVLGEGLGLSIGVYDKEAGKKIKRPKRR